MSSSLLILTCVSRKIDETDERRHGGRERDQGGREGKKRERKNHKINHWHTRAGLRQGDCNPFPLHPRLAEAATGLARCRSKMADYVTVINP